MIIEAEKINEYDEEISNVNYAFSRLPSQTTIINSNNQIRYRWTSFYALFIPTYSNPPSAIEVNFKINFKNNILADPHISVGRALSLPPNDASFPSSFSHLTFELSFHISLSIIPIPNRYKARLSSSSSLSSSSFPFICSSLFSTNSISRFSRLFRLHDISLIYIFLSTTIYPLPLYFSTSLQSIPLSAINHHIRPHPLLSTPLTNIPTHKREAGTGL
ncbi:MAG: hypothetical protein QXP60_02480 [Nitrososphaerota archaeon]